MSLGGFHRHRRLARVALARMAFYADLLPWHSVSQATIQLAQSDVLRARVTTVAPVMGSGRVRRLYDNPERP
jgi:hypothetical protein